MKTTLTVDIEYDENVTDPEGLACAMDRLLETALSTPGIMDEYNNPKVGEFLVAKQAPSSSAPKVILSLSSGVLQEVFGSDPAVEVTLVDWGSGGCSPTDNNVVEVPDDRGGARLALVAEQIVRPVPRLAGTDVAAALKAAGLDWAAQRHPATDMVRRWVIYDPDANALLTTRTYSSYDEACEDAARAHDVLVLPLTYEDLHV